MAHHRYQTEGLVLGHYPIGEANSFVDIFTADLGRVRAVARSVREERSKLRYSLQDLSLVHVSLVRGKDVWRVVGAEAAHNFYHELNGHTAKQMLLVRFVDLIRRLLAGEEENKMLYSAVIDAVMFLRDTELGGDDLGNVECLVVLRVLYNLGYLAKNEHNAAFLDTADMNIDVVALLSPIRLAMIGQINASLQESQL